MSKKLSQLQLSQLLAQPPKWAEASNDRLLVKSVRIFVTSDDPRTGDPDMTVGFGSCKEQFYYDVQNPFWWDTHTNHNELTPKYVESQVMNTLKKHPDWFLTIMLEVNFADSKTDRFALGGRSKITIDPKSSMVSLPFVHHSFEVAAWAVFSAKEFLSKVNDTPQKAQKEAQKDQKDQKVSSLVTEASFEFDPSRSCDYRSREANRYTRKELESIAQKYGVPYKHIPMKRICESLLKLGSKRNPTGSKRKPTKPVETPEEPENPTEPENPEKPENPGKPLEKKDKSFIQRLFAWFGGTDGQK